MFICRLLDVLDKPPQLQVVGRGAQPEGAAPAASAPFPVRILTDHLRVLAHLRRREAVHLVPVVFDGPQDPCEDEGVHGVEAAHHEDRDCWEGGARVGGRR